MPDYGIILMQDILCAEFFRRGYNMKLINNGLEAKGFAQLESAVCRKLEERNCAALTAPVVTYTLCKDMNDDEYKVTADASKVDIVCGGVSGAFAATGCYLRKCGFDGKGAFEPFAGTFALKPENVMHGMYFASHFRNFYEDAPIDKVYRVLDDLALWGGNALAVWFDMHQFKGINTPEAQAMVNRLIKILSYAALIGMKTIMTTLANESFSTSDPAMRAEWTVQNGYFREPRGHYHVEICPNKEGGLKEILKQRREVMDAFKSVHIDYISIWPYDQGGCTCAKCKPWGANGFLKTMDALHELYAEIMPDTKLLCATWYFDRFIHGEWAEFIDKMNTGKYDYADMLFGYFANEEPIPDSIRNGQMPANKAMISFPEISMYGAIPWGGFGANPMPMRFQNNYTSNGKIYKGGGALPYSEGIFEDINKVLMTSFYSGRTDSAEEVLREYAGFELGLHGKTADDFVKMVMMMEETLKRHPAYKNGNPRDFETATMSYDDVRFVIENPEKANEIKSICDSIDAEMADKLRKSWKWRILYIRAHVDAELVNHPLEYTEHFDECMQELVDIYHAQHAYYVVTPIVRNALDHPNGGKV